MFYCLSLSELLENRLPSHSERLNPVLQKKGFQITLSEVIVFQLSLFAADQPCPTDPSQGTQLPEPIFVPKCTLYPRGALLLLQRTFLRLSDTTTLSTSTPEVHRAIVSSISYLAQPKCALPVYVTSGAKHILVKTLLLPISWYTKFHSPTLQCTYNWVWIWFKKI